PIRRADGARQRHAIERGQVLTLEEPDQGGGAVESGAVQVLHGVRSSPSGREAYGTDVTACRSRLPAEADLRGRGTEHALARLPGEQAGAHARPGAREENDPQLSNEVERVAGGHGIAGKEADHRDRRSHSE